MRTNRDGESGRALGDGTRKVERGPQRPRLGRSRSSELSGKLSGWSLYGNLGLPRGAHVLAAQLSDAGLRVDSSPPEERRGIGQEIVHGRRFALSRTSRQGLSGEQRLRRWSACYSCVQESTPGGPGRRRQKIDATHSSRPYCFAQVLAESATPPKSSGPGRIQPRSWIVLPVALRRGKRWLRERNEICGSAE